MNSQVSPYRRHVQAWQDCMNCELCSQRQQVVFARGSIPCDVLFCGEAPGESENILGQPFVGPAGKLLDSIVNRAIEHLTYDLSVGFYNLVGCFPQQAKADGNHEPPEEAIVACSSKLQQFVAIAKPRLIVCVGKLSQGWLEQGYKHSIKLPREIKQCHITHPAAILRAPIVSRGLLVQRAVVTIQQALEELS